MNNEQQEHGRFYNTSKDPAVIEARRQRAIRAGATRRANRKAFLDAYYAKKAAEQKDAQ